MLQHQAYYCIPILHNSFSRSANVAYATMLLLDELSLVLMPRVLLHARKCKMRLPAQTLCTERLSGPFLFGMSASLLEFIAVNTKHTITRANYRIMRLRISSSTGTKTLLHLPDLTCDV